MFPLSGWTKARLSTDLCFCAPAFDCMQLSLIDGDMKDGAEATLPEFAFHFPCGT